VGWCGVRVGTMSFVEDFPSIVEKEPELWNHRIIVGESSEILRIISEHCLDKERVREAIDKTKQ